MYVCNMVTQPGETDNMKTSDHIKIINNYLYLMSFQYSKIHLCLLHHNYNKRQFLNIFQHYRLERLFAIYFLI